MLKILQDDTWLSSMESDLNCRHNRYTMSLRQIEEQGGIIAYSSAHLYFGFQYDTEEEGWWLREWLPKAREVFLMGDFNDWGFTSLPLTHQANGIWAIFLPDYLYKNRIVEGTLYKLYIHGHNGFLQRVSAYTRLMSQDKITKNFTPIIYMGDDYDWEDDRLREVRPDYPIIYEAHIGMSSEESKISSYKEFEQHILPRISKNGYNTIQLMALAEHPYYGSYGYHVSNLFAPCSAFGSPSELKSLIHSAHKYGIAVVMDIVHSHYVKNRDESIGHLDGSDGGYSPMPPRDYHPYWDSYTYDYSKPEVVRYLLSNIRYWAEEFHVDGFRFDGITSMLYYNHGYQEFSNGVSDYMGSNINYDALLYLTLANKLIKTINPALFTIAEDVSGMPALCYPCDDGGIGFDYRLGMSQPDFWIDMLNKPESEWSVETMWKELNNRLPDTKTIAYCESHDQSLQGDKTIAFRLMDSSMYHLMDKCSNDTTIRRGVSLHKMIRLFTITTGGSGYLNFMGNEFGHPEWVDFPRPENNWSYDKARRQWSLADNGYLQYEWMGRFDKAMIHLVREYNLFDDKYGYLHHTDEANKLIIFSKGKLLFVFCWHAHRYHSSYQFNLDAQATYSPIFSSEQSHFGGKVDESIIGTIYTTEEKGGNSTLTLPIRPYEVCVYLSV